MDLSSSVPGLILINTWALLVLDFVRTSFALLPQPNESFTLKPAAPVVLASEECLSCLSKNKDGIQIMPQGIPTVSRGILSAV